VTRTFTGFVKQKYQSRLRVACELTVSHTGLSRLASNVVDSFWEHASKNLLVTANQKCSWSVVQLLCSKSVAMGEWTSPTNLAVRTCAQANAQRDFLESTTAGRNGIGKGGRKWRISGERICKSMQVASSRAETLVLK
jgi:hypothetical protein